MSIIYSGYVDAMRIGAERAQPFARELVHAAPLDLQIGERKALEIVVEYADEIDDVLNDRERGSNVRVRPFIQSCINTWGGSSDGLLAIARIPADVSDRGPRAADLHARLFPEGSSWLKSEAEVLWSRANRLLARIEEEKLEREIEALLGRDVHDAMVTVTQALGEAIGVGRKPRAVTSGPSLAEKTQGLSRAVGAYCRQLAANVDESDPESVERFRKAVAPIDAYRSRASATVEEEEEEPVTPEPEAPEAPRES
jgi:hypothetical protein